MTDDTPRFTWEAVRDAVSYELWVSSLTAPNGPVINVNVSGAVCHNLWDFSARVLATQSVRGHQAILDA